MNPVENPAPHFSGRTFQAKRDGARLSEQYWRVYALMCDGRWRTLRDIAALTQDPEASISARLRDMRKLRFGGHTVQREFVDRGLWRYRVIITPAKESAT